ncbi:hypothetical protein Cgig2_027205 [Carnegiea gigantea]|uniref:Uncharacterized protein n=1 Tax=Carnegiea gigantea TaxID=171969 RepID=A0A9Q1GH60_9CARY|nr:hypothetical protein Cgig2_027205 [Carnegiea gigantea]
MGTCSSMTFGGSEEAKGLGPHDLTRRSTRHLPDSSLESLMAILRAPCEDDPLASPEATWAVDSLHNPVEATVQPRHSLMGTGRSSGDGSRCRGHLLPDLLARALVHNRLWKAQRNGRGFPDKEAGSRKKVVIPEVRQLGKPVKELPVTRFDPPTFGLFARIHYSRHGGGKGIRPVILPNIILEIAHSFPFFKGWLLGSSSEFRISLLSFQSGRSAQPIAWCTKRKSYFQFFNFDFFLMAPVCPVSFEAFCTLCTNLKARPVQDSPHSS